MDIMKAILDIESKAMDIIGSVDREREWKKTEAVLDEMEQKNKAQTEKRIQALREENEKQLAAEIEETRRKTAAQEKRIMAEYEAKKDAWILDITDRITKG